MASRTFRATWTFGGTFSLQHPRGKYDPRLSRAASGWKDPDDVMEALFALCRKAVENEPLKIFLALSDLDRRRSAPLGPATVERLMRDYHAYSAQYTDLQRNAVDQRQDHHQFPGSGPERQPGEGPAVQGR